MINSPRPGNLGPGMPNGANPYAYAGRANMYQPPGATEGWSSVDYSYMTGLPRPLEQFTSGDFSPLAPIFPVPVDIPEPPNGRPRPRRFQFPVGFNLPVGQPGTEGLKLACYSDDTEILTRRGWKLFRDLLPDDDVATRSEAGVFEWQRPLEYFDRQYDGPLVNFTSRGIDLLVTPNHRVLYKRPGGTRELIRPASYLLGLRKPAAMVATSEWAAPDVDRVAVTAPSTSQRVSYNGARVRWQRRRLGWSVDTLAAKAGFGRQVISRLERRSSATCQKVEADYLATVRRVCEVLGLPAQEVVTQRQVERLNVPFTMSGDDFAAFMGAFLSEGCVSGRTVHISQGPASKGFDEYRALLCRVFGAEPSYSGITWRVSSHPGLREYLASCGHLAHNKRIPPEVLDLSARQLRIFWHFYLLGDGYVEHGNETLVTASSVMAGQLQEVAEKMGWSAVTKQRRPTPGPHYIAGREIFPGEPVYDVRRRRTRAPLWTKATEVGYSGHVYCVRVPNGILYVRRNGKAIWSGNTFQQLIDLAEIPSIARVCIEIRKSDLITSGDDRSWDIVPTAKARADMQGNPKKRADWESRKAEAEQLFENPDPDNYEGFEDWANALLEDALVLDGVALYVQPCGGKGNGPCGSDIGALSLIDASTVKPLLNEWGARPEQPAPAYQQYVWGVPRVDLMDAINLGPDATIEEYKALNPLVENLMTQVDEWVGSEMIYFVSNRRTRTPYGFGPVEQGIVPISILTARQQWQWEFFRAGSIPSVFVDPGESIATPEEARLLMQALNQLQGDLANMHQVIVLPPGAKVDPQKPVDLSSDFDTWIVALTCMPFGLGISDLGITPKLASIMSPAEAKQAANQASDRTTRRSALPLARKLASGIFNRLLRGKLGQPDMRWSWGDMGLGDSRTDKIADAVNLLKSSVTSIDETRIALEMDPLGENWATVPLQFLPTGIIPMGQLPPAPPGGPAPALSSGNAIDVPSRPAPPKPPAPKPTEAPDPGKTVVDQALSTVPDSTDEARTSEGDTGPTAAKAKTDELRALRRYLRRGGRLERFEPKALRRSALKAAKGEPDSARAALKVAKAQHRLDRRERDLAKPRAALTARLTEELAELRAGKLSTQQFAQSAIAILASAYAAAQVAGHGAAQAEHGDDVSLPSEATVQSQAQARALGMFPYLKDLALDTLAGASANKVLAAAAPSQAQGAVRLGDYGDTLTAPYEQGYVQAAPQADGTSTAIVWHTEDDPCDLCADRDGQSYSEQTLPGFPGDQGFGDLCEGGPNCKCWLSFEHGESVLAQTQQPAIARSAALGSTPSWVTGQPSTALPSLGPLSRGKARTQVVARARQTASDQGEVSRVRAPKDISVGSPLASGFVPFDLAPGVRRTYPAPDVDKQNGEERADAAARMGGGGPTSDDYALTNGIGRLGHKADASATEHVPFAGLALRAADTGRVLLLQRAMGEGDAAAGKWELPGGHLEEDETPWEGATREWQEEVGAELPSVRLIGQYDVGGYRTHVGEVPSEGDVNINWGPSREVANPDGDAFEACAWFDPAELPGLSLRPELAANLAQLSGLLRTPALKARSDPFHHKGPLEHKVHDYLREHYPEKSTGWVCHSAWEKSTVPLSAIAYKRRPGGRDEAKVAKFARKFAKGKHLDRVVLVDQGTAGKMVVADGYHRLAGAERAGKTHVDAFVGTPRPGAGDWKANIRKMQFEANNMAGAEGQDDKARSEKSEEEPLEAVMARRSPPEVPKSPVAWPEGTMVPTPEVVSWPQASTEALHAAAGWKLGEKLKAADLEMGTKQEGNVEPLLDWYRAGAAGGISWGEHPSDFYDCVNIAGQYVDDPEAFCAVRHQEVTGDWPGQEHDKAR